MRHGAPRAGMTNRTSTAARAPFPLRAEDSARTLQYIRRPTATTRRAVRRRPPRRSRPRQRAASRSLGKAQYRRALALAPMPPRPEEMTALSSFALPPGPPSLPLEIASAGTIPFATRTDATSGYGRGPEITAATDPRRAGAAAEDRAQLRALFAAVLTKVDAGVEVKVATARVRTQADAPSGLIAEPASGFSPRFSAGTGDEPR